jgi:hypothetical protein
VPLATCSSYRDLVTYDEHRLILRHFSDWAVKKKRVVDAELVGELIELRASYTSWSRRTGRQVRSNT